MPGNASRPPERQIALVARGSSGLDAGSIQKPEDVARAAVWLAPDTFNGAIGTTLFIDGGMTLYPGSHENG